MTRLLIEPADVWLFRDGKPFRAGEDHWITSLFPPTPFTIQGVIRSKILLDSQVDLSGYAQTPQAYAISRQIGGPGVGYGDLQIKGPFLAARQENGKWKRYYPAPATLVRDKVSRAYHYLEVKHSPLRANWPSIAPDNLHPLILPQNVDDVEAVSGWLDQDALQNYLENGQPPQPESILWQRRFVQRESRFNIKLERSRHRPQPEFLTEIDFIRLRAGYALDVDIEGIDVSWAKQGYLGIGGEGGTGYYQVDESPGARLGLSNPLPPQFMLYLATPTRFERGWHPASWDNWFEGGSCQLVAAAVNRPQRIGGWDIARKQARPMHAYVPPGSVYFFKSEGELFYNNRPVTDDPDQGQIGFGQAFIGRWSTK